jgi:hypothetical protein
MPRKSRIDAPGALHHFIVRGIARRKIFLTIPIGSGFWSAWENKFGLMSD